MKSNIIKVSIILIFMMFFAGLFNFCFAWTEGVDFNIKETINVSCSASSYNYYNLDFVDISFDLPPEPTTENTTYERGYTNTAVTDALNYYNQNPHVILLREGDSFVNDIFYIVCGGEPSYILHLNSSSSNMSFFDSNGSLISSDYSLRYNYEENKWYAGQTDMLGFSYQRKSNNSLYHTYYVNVPYSIYDCGTEESNLIYNPVLEPSIKMEVNQTGTKTGHVTFTPENWTGSMYYIKDDMDELTRLIAEEELSPIHDKVKLYSGPIAIEYGEYVMGLLFDSNGEMVFSEISDSVTIDHDSILDDTHKLYLDKENENIYYLSIHGYQIGDYIRASNIPIGSNLYDEKDTIILNNYSSEYNGLTIGYLYETALHHMNRKVTVNKNGITYFYLYDSNNNLINTVVLNSSNYYSGEEYDFDVELNYGNCFSEEGVLGIVPQEICTWVKVKPIINVPSIDNYELYFRIKDYGNIGYIQEEYRNIGLYHDNQMKKVIGFDTKNSPTQYVRIDDLIYDYFYIATNQNGTTTFTFSLELRSKSGQVIETKEFTVNLSEWNKEQGTVSSTTNGKDDTYIRNPNELSGNISSSNKFDFSGLNDLTEEDLKTNVEGLIDSSIGFFSLFSTIFLLLPTWVSSLLYLFFFGMIIITLLRFIRGS